MQLWFPEMFRDILYDYSIEIFITIIFKVTDPQNAHFGGKIPKYFLYVKK